MTTYPPVMIDSRIGSNDLYPLLQQRRVPVELCKLRFADVALVGNGPAGNSVFIGVERKRIRDLIASLMTGRMAGHQLPGLVEEYPYRWVVVEGAFKTSDRGTIEIPKGHGKWEDLGFDAVGLEGYLLTLEMKGGCFIKRSYDVRETVQFVEGLFNWWVKKTWDEHHSHLAMYTPPEALVLAKPALVRRWAKELKGIGFDKSGPIAERFKTGLGLACATEAELREVPGVGKTLAAQIVREMQEGK